MKNFPSKKSIHAMRLLEKLRIPSLILASDLDNSKTPHSPVSHPPRNEVMETYDQTGSRMADTTAFKHPVPDNIITKLTRRLRRCRAEKLVSEPRPEGWYQQRRRAEKKIRELSGGQILLDPYQIYYHGDDHTHWAVHVACSNRFRLALNELEIEGPEFICPFCHGGLLSRVGSVDQINEYIFNISHNRILFIKNQPLACTHNPHTFFHLDCRERFDAAFDHVVEQNLSGAGSGCPLCDK